MQRVQGARVPEEQDNTSSELREPALKGAGWEDTRGPPGPLPQHTDGKELSQGHVQNERVVTGVQALMGGLP